MRYTNPRLLYFYFTFKQTNKQTDEQMDSTDALSRSRYRERRLNNTCIVSMRRFLFTRKIGPTLSRIGSDSAARGLILEQGAQTGAGD